MQPFSRPENMTESPVSCISRYMVPGILVIVNTLKFMLNTAGSDTILQIPSLESNYCLFYGLIPNSFCVYSQCFVRQLFKCSAFFNLMEKKEVIGLFPRWWVTSAQNDQAKIYWRDPDNKGHMANMGPTWVLSAPDGLHVGPMNLAIRGLASKMTSGSHAGVSKLAKVFLYFCGPFY